MTHKPTEKIIRHLQGTTQSMVKYETASTADTLIYGQKKGARKTIIVAPAAHRQAWKEIHKHTKDYSESKRGRTRLSQ